MRVFSNRITSCLFFIFFISISLFGQFSPYTPSCAFDEMNLHEGQNHPHVIEEIREFKEHCIPLLSSHDRSAVEPIMTISVVVHVIHSGEPIGEGANISDQQIFDQIAILNEDYCALNEKYYETPSSWLALAGIPNIQFLLATVDPNGQPTNGITRHNLPITGSSWNNNNINSEIKPAVNWDPNRYLNIYVLSIPGTTSAGGVVGFSNYPIPSAIGSDRDGPVIDYNWFGGPGHPVSAWRPISHEMGHFLGLPHPFDGNSCNNDDGIGDTPNVDSPTRDHATLDCSNGFPTAPQSCGNDHLFVNYMDYVTENCYTSFTEGQVGVMRSVLDGTSSGFGYGSREDLITNAPMQTDIPENDAGIVRLISPDETNCTADVLIPVVTLRNFGSADLTEVTINYKVNDGSITSYHWQGSLFSGELTQVTLPSFIPPDGTYEFTVYTSDPNNVTDDRSSNDEFKSTLLTYFAFDPPLIEPADTETSFPTSLGTWQFNFGSDDFTWEITNEASAYGFGTESFVFNNRAGDSGNNPFDTYDLLITRHFDFSNVTNAALYFDLAYATYNDIQVDTLYVLVSLDCSQNFNTFVYKKWGSDLATAPPTQNEFTPNPNQWKSEGVDLSFFDGMDDVTIGFLNVSNWGNRLFIDNIRVGVDCGLLTDEWDITPDGCDSNCNGEATVNVPVSNGALYYEWENGPAGVDLSSVDGLCAGQVQVTITDEFGCQILATNEIPQSSTPDAIISFTKETSFQANDGTATASVSNAALPITYTWSNGIAATVNEFSHTIVDLAPGNYQVTITDASGCEITDQISVTSVCDGFDVNVTTSDALCFGEPNGTATANPVNGNGTFNFNWSNGVFTQTNNSLDAGTHSVTVTDVNACPAVESFDINEPDLLTLSISSSNETGVNANDGMATANVSGGTQGYSYLWNTGANTQTINNLSANTYFVTVTDENGCTATETVTIQSFNCADFSASISGNDISCFGQNDGSALVTVTGATNPVNYTWSNGGNGQMISGLSENEYSVVVLDGSGCSAELSINIQEPTPLNISISSTNVTSTNGNDGTATVSASGGTPFPGSVYQYNWSNGGNAQMISGLNANTYFVTVTDANGCSNTASVEVFSIDCQLSIELDFQNASCPNVADGSISVVDVPGSTLPLSYNWSNGSTESNIENLLSGNYTVTVTDALGCMVSGWIPLSEADVTPPTLMLEDEIIVYVGNGATSFDPSIADIGSFDNCSMINLTANQNSFDCSNLGENAVLISASDANGNEAEALLNVIVRDTVFPNIDCPDDISETNCSNIIYDLPSANDNCGIDALEIIEGLESGSDFPVGMTQVMYEAIDLAGNISTCSFEVLIENDFTVDSSEVVHAVGGQANGAIMLWISGGNEPYQIQWFSNGIELPIFDSLNVSPGTYSIVLTDAAGCTFNIGPFEVDNLSNTISKDHWKKITLFPNPTNGDVSVKFDGYIHSGKVDISIFDVNGKMCLKKKINSINSENRFNVDHLGAGIFWVKLLIENDVVWKKLIIL